jgi:PBP1b-binding outer membrane lipoprotein LpoB
MKFIISVLIIAALILTACNNDKTKETTKISSSEKKMTTDSTLIAHPDIEKQKEELIKLTPLPDEQLKALIPETLMGGQRKNHDINASIGTNVASGEYEISDSTSITLNIYDCSGAGGSGIYGMHLTRLVNDQHDNADDYKKSVEFNGGKAFEQCDKVNNECTFSYFTGGRYLVTLEGHGIRADALKLAAKGLNIK